MNNRRLLIVDADLTLADESGSIISLRLESGQGVVEFSDAALLRKFIKDSLLSKKRRKVLQHTLRLADIAKPRVDISVVGKHIAQVNTENGGGYLCSLMGLPGLRIRPFALISVLFK